MEEVEREVKIGELGIIRFGKIGMMEVSYPFIVSSKQIVSAFVYDLFEGRFINAKTVDHDNKKLVFELEPNNHILFSITCDNNVCELKLFDINVRRELIDDNGYDYEETKDVIVNEVYSARLYRDMYRSISNCKDTPNILAFILAYLIPIDLPDVYYHFLTTDEVVKEIKRFFET